MARTVTQIFIEHVREGSELVKWEETKPYAAKPIKCSKRKRNYIYQLCVNKIMDIDDKEEDLRRFVLLGWTTTRIVIENVREKPCRPNQTK